MKPLVMFWICTALVGLYLGADIWLLFHGMSSWPAVAMAAFFTVLAYFHLWRARSNL